MAESPKSNASGDREIAEDADRPLSDREHHEACALYAESTATSWRADEEIARSGAENGVCRGRAAVLSKTQRRSKFAYCR